MDTYSRPLSTTYSKQPSHHKVPALTPHKLQQLHATWKQEPTTSNKYDAKPEPHWPQNKRNKRQSQPTIQVLHSQSTSFNSCVQCENTHQQWAQQRRPTISVRSHKARASTAACNVKMDTYSRPISTTHSKQPTRSSNLNFNLAFQIGISKLHLKVAFQLSISNWHFKLVIEIDISMLAFQICISNAHFKFACNLCNYNLHFKCALQMYILDWHFKLTFRSCISKLHFTIVFKFHISKLYVKTVLQCGNPNWHLKNAFQCWYFKLPVQVCIPIWYFEIGLSSWHFNVPFQICISC